MDPSALFEALARVLPVSSLSREARAVKAAFDPKGILNPARIFPEVA